MNGLIWMMVLNRELMRNSPLLLVIGFGDQLDPSNIDTEAGFRYAFACDGGSVSEATYETANLSASHLCAWDDGPAVQTVRARIFDQDGGFSEYTTEVEVLNASPTATLSDEGPVNEGSPVLVAFGDQLDPSEADTTFGFTYSYDCENDGVYGPVDTTPTTTCTFDDGPAVQTVRARIFDQDGDFSEVATEVEVLNAPPTADAGSDQSGFWGLPVSLRGGAFDPSGADSAALSPSWASGDGQTARFFDVFFTYGDPGLYTATLTASDKDGGAGSDQAQVRVLKRGTTLSYDSSTASAPFGFAVLSARLDDLADPATARLAGRELVFTVGGVTYSTTTDTDGVASVVPFPPLLPGIHPVEVSFAGDGHYRPSSGAATLRVASTPGRVNGAGLRLRNDARASFEVKLKDKRGDDGKLKAELEFKLGSFKFHGKRPTGLGIAPDGHSAWLAGVDKNGQSFVAYVEDRGKHGEDEPDVFRLWIAGVEKTGDGRVAQGDVRILPG